MQHDVLTFFLYFFQKAALNLLCCKCAMRKLKKRRRNSQTTYSEGMNPMMPTHSVLTDNKSCACNNSPVTASLNKSSFL